MIRHQLLLILRGFVRFKSTFFINLIGLSTALACTLLIYLWVSDERSVDTFHEKEGRLFQVMSNEVINNEVITNDGTADALGETWMNEMPEVEMATVITPPSWFQKFTVSGNEHHVNASGYFADKNYFNVFSYPLIKGNKEQVLADKNAIVISEQLAMKLFQTTDCIGKTIEWKWFDLKKECAVTGIFSQVPQNSTQQFDFIVSFDAWNEIMNAPAGLSPGGPFNTFVVLKEGTDADAFNARISGFVKSKFPQATSSLFLRPYSEGYLYGNYENGKQSGGRIEYVKLFSVIAVFILLIACINFMNLFTAKASRRIKEVGIKKAVGAHRSTLIAHYLSEAMVMSFLSLFVSLLMVDLALPAFNSITGKELSLQVNASVVFSFLGIAFLTGLIAGSYPALYLSGFQPAAVLKGKISSSLGELWARKGLVIFQFTVSIVFIVAVAVVYRQVEFVQTKNLGYQKDQVIYFDMEGNAAKNPQTFLSEIKTIPGVVHASSSQFTPVASYSQAIGIRWDGKNQDDRIRFAQMAVNDDLIETLGIKMNAGRSFSSEFRSDTTAVIFNETAIKAMELKDPVGKIISMGGADRTIIGVVNDFHFQSLHEKVKPFFFRFAPRETIVVIVKLEQQRQAETLVRLKEFYAAYNSGLPMDYHFLDGAYQQQYDAEQKIASLSRYFAGLAILISCLGLLGLAAFTAERRRKEISIRKVLGSAEWQIIYLLSADFTRIVMVAVVIALPFSYWMAHRWLDGFAYKAEITIWYFVSAGMITVMIALLTVGTQAFRAAQVNPTENLRGD